MNLNKLETHKRITISGLPGSFPKTNSTTCIFSCLIGFCTGAFPRGAL